MDGIWNLIEYAKGFLQLHIFEGPCCGHFELGVFWSLPSQCPVRGRAQSRCSTNVDWIKGWKATESKEERQLTKFISHISPLCLPGIAWCPRAQVLPFPLLVTRVSLASSYICLKDQSKVHLLCEALPDFSLPPPLPITLITVSHDYPLACGSHQTKRFRGQGHIFFLFPA